MLKVCSSKKTSPRLKMSVLERRSRGEGEYWQVRDDSLEVLGSDASRKSRGPVREVNVAAALVAPSLQVTSDLAQLLAPQTSKGSGMKKQYVKIRMNRWIQNGKSSDNATSIATKDDDQAIVPRYLRQKHPSYLKLAQCTSPSTW